jgi:hypothetical protein
LVTNDTYGLFVADAFRGTFTGGGRTVVTQVNFTRLQESYMSELQLLADSNPEVVFLVGYPEDGFTILKEWWENKDERGWHWEWFLSSLMKFQSLIDDLRLHNVDVRGVKGIAPIFKGPNYYDFYIRYVTVFEREPWFFDAHTYDTLHVIALAAVAGNSMDSFTIRDNLIKVANPPGEAVGIGPDEFRRAVAILEAGGDIYFQGASSLVNFDLLGDVGASFEIWTINETWEFEEVGNLSEWDVWEPVFDTTPPTISVSSPTVGAFVGSSDITVVWSAKDVGSAVGRVEVSLDGGAPVVVSGTLTGYTFTNVADGPHTIEIVAFDVAGNSNLLVVDFFVDTAPPTLSLLLPEPEAIINSDRVVVSWTAEDAIAGVDYFEVSLDLGDPVRVADTSYTFEGVADGTHSVTVKAFDAAGNAQTDSLEFRVDTNIFSPTGPYGVFPLIVVPVAGAAVAATTILLVVRRRRRPPM